MSRLAAGKCQRTGFRDTIPGIFETNGICIGETFRTQHRTQSRIGETFRTRRRTQSRSSACSATLVEFAGRHERQPWPRLRGAASLATLVRTAKLRVLGDPGRTNSWPRGADSRPGSRSRSRSGATGTLNPDADAIASVWADENADAWRVGITEEQHRKPPLDFSERPRIMR